MGFSRKRRVKSEEERGKRELIERVSVLFATIATCDESRVTRYELRVTGYGRPSFHGELCWAESSPSPFKRKQAPSAYNGQHPRQESSSTATATATPTTTTQIFSGLSLHPDEHFNKSSLGYHDWSSLPSLLRIFLPIRPLVQTRQTITPIYSFICLFAYWTR